MSPNDKLNGAVPVLKYFQGKGRSEGFRFVLTPYSTDNTLSTACSVIFFSFRLIFEDLGLKYEDVRYSHAEWPAVKQEMLSSGASLFGQLPVVVVNGKTLTQSFAIYRYFARIFGIGDIPTVIPSVLPSLSVFFSTQPFPLILFVCLFFVFFSPLFTSCIRSLWLDPRRAVRRRHDLGRLA